LTRLPELGSSDRAALDALLDDSTVAHVGFVRADGPAVVPTAIARDGDQLLMHGSTGSGWMRQVATGMPVAVAVTSVEGLVVARSAFESSMLYRSAVVFGSCTPLAGGDKRAALDLLTDHLIPGRVAELREPSPKELAATLVLALPIRKWSLKISRDWPEDPEDDVAGPAWAGWLRSTTSYGGPEPAPDLRDGIPVPPSVRTLAGRPRPPAGP
jgi:nitroimidazol reductase NimA-like FMN-containing flavoprotein (pyridoxamine 5'-phosphate oxidase superfamily)